MTANLYGLLVGIDAYESPISGLKGCRNDVRHLGDYLRARLGDAADIVTLEDDAATRAGVIAGFTEHLAQARSGDVAFFSYAGHGSEELVPDEISGSEATGRLQNLLVYDAGRETDGEIAWPLADKELGLLLDQVADQGAHVVAVFDSCHSGDVTRGASTATARQWLPGLATSDDPTTRSIIDTLEGPRPVDAFIDGALERVARNPTPRHVALSACQPWQLANENIVDKERRGMFSSSLLEVLKTIGRATTYRSVLAAVQARIEREYPDQRPVLFPIDPGGPADGAFLEGTIEPAPPSFSMTMSADGWSVDAGSIQGLRAPSNGEEFRLVCSKDHEVCGHVRVVSVEAGRSLVEPIDWEPADTAYEAVISSAPRPLVTITFDPTEGDRANDAFERVRQRLATSGPDGGPSPFVREQTDAPSSDSIGLRVRFDESGPEGASLQLLRADGSVAISTVPSIPCDDASEAARTAVEQLEHLGKWEQRKEPSCHRPELAEAVQLKLYTRYQGEKLPPPDRDPIVPLGEYTIPVGTERSTRVWFQTTNTSDRDLYVALLFLTDHYGCDVLVPAERMAPEATRNIPITLALSDTVEARPGASSREWVKLLVSGTEFDAGDFKLPAIDAPKSRGATVEETAETPAAADWCSTTTGLVLHIPANVGAVDK